MVADYESDVRFSKFKVANPIWLQNFDKFNLRFVISNLENPYIYNFIKEMVNLSKIFRHFGFAILNFENLTADLLSATSKTTEYNMFSYRFKCAMTK